MRRTYGWGGRTEAAEPHGKERRHQGVRCHPLRGEGASNGACPKPRGAAERPSSEKAAGTTLAVEMGPPRRVLVRRAQKAGHQGHWAWVPAGQ